MQLQLIEREWCLSSDVCMYLNSSGLIFLIERTKKKNNNNRPDLFSIAQFWKFGAWDICWCPWIIRPSECQLIMQACCNTWHPTKLRSIGWCSSTLLYLHCMIVRIQIDLSWPLIFFKKNTICLQIGSVVCYLSLWIWLVSLSKGYINPTYHMGWFGTWRLLARCKVSAYQEYLHLEN